MQDQVVYYPGMSMDEISDQIAMKAFQHFKSMTLASQSLGIAPNTLRKRIDRYEEKIKKHKEAIASEQEKARIFLRRQRGLD